MSQPVAFDEDTWAEDMRRASPAAREIAAQARRAYEADGVPVRELRRCETEGPDGT